MTNQDAIDQAMFYAGILSAGDSANATDSADMLTQLNQMMAAWSVDSKDLQFPPQDTLTDTFPVPAWAESGVIANLGIRACTLFEMTVTQQLAVLASEGYKLIAKTLINKGLEPRDMSHMPQGSEYYNSASILNGINRR